MVKAQVSIPATELPLIASRLKVPMRGRGVLPRPRLETLAQHLFDYPLTLLTTPAGFGKTTLACAWADRLMTQGITCSWLSLDGGEDDAGYLLYCLAASVRQALPSQPLTSLTLAQDLPLVPTEALATQLLNDLSDYGEPLQLIIDDCHSVSDATLTKALSTLVRFMPDNVRLLLMSRNPLPAVLLQQVGGSLYFSLGVDELRFQLDETDALLKRSGLQLPADEVTALQQVTRGWSTALRAWLLNRPAEGSAKLPRSLHLFFEGMLEGLPRKLVDDILLLSLVDKFSLPLLTHCLNKDASQLLTELEDKQLFINALDDSGEWFDLHPLFKDYLSVRLAAAISPAKVAELQLKTAIWHAGEGNWFEAINLALEAGADEQAQQWIGLCAMDLVEQGELLTLLNWERQLRNKLTSLPAVLRLALGWAAVLAMQLDETAVLLTGLENSTAINEWEWRALKATWLAMSGRGQEGAELGQQCLPHFENRAWIYNVLLNVVRYGLVQGTQWQEYYQQPPLQKQPLSPSRYVFNRLYRYGIDAIADVRQANLDMASMRLLEMLDMLNQNQSGNPVLFALPKAFLVHLYVLQGNADEAERLLEDAGEFAHLAGFPELVVATQGSRARVLRLKGDYLGARSQLDQIQRLGRARNCSRLLSFVALESSRLALHEQCTSEIASHGQTLNEISKACGQPLEMEATVTELVLLLAQSKGTLPDTLVQRALEQHRALVERSLHLQALELLLTLGAVETALNKGTERFEQACEIADRQHAWGLIDLIVTKQPSAQRTEKRLVLADTQEDVADVNLADYSLTVKERLVLVEIAKGQSNKLVARQLGVSPETIKSHLKSIYSKLGVNNRTQAVQVLTHASALSASGD